MTISLITATLNSSGTIADCLESVNTQTYRQVEQLIIDGQSSDQTLAIIRSTPNRVSRIISEPDNGLYDAMNKGIRMATGDVIGILNSDDLYIDDNVLQDVADRMNQTGADSLYADLYYVKAGNTGKILRHWKTNEFVPGSFSKGWHPPHPTFFVRKEIYEKYGLFDTTLKVSADFELMLRFLEKHRISSCYLPRPILRMRHGGESSGTLKKILQGNINCYRAFKKNNIKVSPFYVVYRSIPKVMQIISRNR